MPPKGSKKKVKKESPTLNGVNGNEEAAKSTETKSSKRKRHVEEVESEPESKPEVEKSNKRQRTRKPVVKEEDQEGGAEDLAEVEGTPLKKTRRNKRAVAKPADEKLDAADEPTGEPAKKPRKGKQVVEDKATEDGEPEKKAPKKRKTKEEKEAENMPLAARTTGHKLFIGAHVSSAGGVQNATTNAVHIGANAFALFLKSQRKWANPPLTDETNTLFHKSCATHSYSASQHIVPHGSYLVNLAHTDAARTTQAYDAFLDDLQRCERLGIKLYNFHPGNTVSNDRPKAIAHLASNLNRAHKATSTVVTLLENMAASGSNVLGSTFEDLRDIIALVEDQSRVGVCLDTCHAFAAGYDLRSPEAFKSTLQRFDDVVGMKYLRALHLNDSKAPFDTKRDLHANIGTGFLGLRAFWNVVNEPRFAALPLVLETPIEVSDEDGAPVKDEKGKVKEDKGIWAQEIKMLEGLVGADVEGEEFEEMEKRLWRKGVPQRAKLEEQQERKRAKEERVKSPKKRKGRAKREEDDESSALSELEDED